MTSVEGSELSEAPDPREASVAAERRLRKAMVVTATSVIVLSIVTTLPFWDAVALPVFFLLFPGLALAQLPLLRVGGIERLSVYAGSAATIATLGTLALGLTFRLEGNWPTLLVPLPWGQLALWSSLLTLGGTAVLGPLSLLDRTNEDRSRLMIQLLPRTGREKIAFAGLSLCAGLGEEMAYRGYALAAVQLTGVGPWPAAVLSAAAFGVLHAYQGPLGTVRTATTGLLLALPVLVTGSIVPAMVAHAAIDLLGGLVVGPRMIRRAERRAGSDVSTRSPTAPLVQPDPRE